jgi:hypothetical protein
MQSIGFIGVIENSRLPVPPLDWRDTGVFWDTMDAMDTPVSPRRPSSPQRSPVSKASFPMVQKVPRSNPWDYAHESVSPRSVRAVVKSSPWSQSSFGQAIINR